MTSVVGNSNTMEINDYWFLHIILFCVQPKKEIQMGLERELVSKQWLNFKFCGKYPLKVMILMMIVRVDAIKITLQECKWLRRYAWDCISKIFPEQTPQIQACHVSCHLFSFSCGLMPLYCLTYQINSSRGREILCMQWRLENSHTVFQ